MSQTRDDSLAKMDARLGPNWTDAVLAELADHFEFLCSRGRTGRVYFEALFHDGKPREAHVNGTKIPRALLTHSGR